MILEFKIEFWNFSESFGDYIFSFIFTDWYIWMKSRIWHREQIFIELYNYCFVAFFQSLYFSFKVFGPFVIFFCSKLFLLML